MKPVLLLIFCLFTFKVFAQETSVSGIIFDTDSKDRIARVNVLNLSTGVSVYDNLNGVFSIDAKPGDMLLFSQAEHLPDTIRVANYTPLAVYMKRNSIQLRQVNILDSILNPQKRLEANKRDFSKAYGSLASKEFLTSMSPGGAGLGIDAIWNSFSRSGRNAAHLREVIESDYKQDMIDSRFNRTLVGRVTGLTGKQLTDFMQKYRPGYFLVTYASEYEFINSIKTNYKRYLRNPLAHTLAPLYPPKPAPVVKEKPQ
jgi:hypothetical protein